MKSLDTNLLFIACVAHAEGHDQARGLVDGWSDSPEVVICEQVLMELYNLLRNPAVMSGKPMDAVSAVEVIEQFRQHPRWRIVENASVMQDVWKYARGAHFPRRRIFDARIALTLICHGVTELATVNCKDFQSFGFAKVWNPLEN